MHKRIVLVCAAWLALGCNHRPSDAFIHQFQKLQVAGEPPTLTVHLHQSLVIPDTPDFENIRNAVEILANQMGFRVEATHLPRKGWIPDRTQFDFTGFQAQSLPGLNFTQEGDFVRLKPDLSQQIIVEWVKPPAEAFQAMVASQNLLTESLKGDLAVLPRKDRLEMVEKLTKAEADLRKATVEEFMQNVARATKDSGCVRAWVIQFRQQESSSIPKDSPFWRFSAALPAGTAPPVLVSDPAYRTFQRFLAHNGKPDPKASIQTCTAVAFQDASGACIKTKPWSFFLPE